MKAWCSQKTGSSGDAAPAIDPPIQRCTLLWLAMPRPPLMPQPSILLRKPVALTLFQGAVSYTGSPSARSTSAAPGRVTGAEGH